MFKREMKRIAILIVGVMFFVSNGFSLGVSPAVVCISGLEIGDDKDTGVDYTITNESAGEQEFTLEVIAPIMPSDESLKGYSKLPDLAWLYVEKTDIIIPAKSTGTSRIHVKIPKEEKYYNQHWAVSCHIKQKGIGFVNVAVAPFIMIETKFKDKTSERPYGEFGLSPGIIGVEFDRSENKKASFNIYNNGLKDCVYKIKSFVPDTKNNNAKISPTDGFEWAKDAKWVKIPSDNLKIKGGEYKEVVINIDCPKDLKIPEGRKGIEAMIFIESENLQKRFVRVLITK